MMRKMYYQSPVGRLELTADEKGLCSLAFGETEQYAEVQEEETPFLKSVCSFGTGRRFYGFLMGRREAMERSPGRSDAPGAAGQWGWPTGTIRLRLSFPATG